MVLPSETLLTPVYDEQGEDLKGLVEQLRREVAALKQDLVDANIEIQATVDEFERTQVELEAAKKSLEKAKDEAVRANAVKSAFLASMSHELRTPLNSIINFSKFVYQGVMGPVNEEQKAALLEVVDSGKHLLGLINDVLDMSKIESGALRLFVEDDVNIQAVLESAYAKSRGLILEKPVEMSLEIDGTLPAIQADRQRVLQILLNILSNACKFTDEGHIRIHAAQKDNHIVISVRDTGPGIAPEDQIAVFEAFRQTETGLRQGGGTGLGMPISQKLVEAHGGRIWLESAKGQGACFYVSLPLRARSGSILLT